MRATCYDLTTSCRLALVQLFKFRAPAHVLLATCCVGARASCASCASRLSSKLAVLGLPSKGRIRKAVDELLASRGLLLGGCGDRGYLGFAGGIS